MIKIIDIQKEDNAEKVLKVQTAAYKVEASIINFYEIPPLKDTVATLRKSGEIFIGYYTGEVICGVIAIKIRTEEIDIYRLVVYPEYFKRGIAQKLVEYVEKHYKCRKINVSTASKNVPATNFYKKNGFKAVKETIIHDQLTLTQFEKKI